MRRYFALIMFLLLPVAGPMVAEDPMGFVKRHQLDCRSEQDCFDKYFLFRGKPVDLRLIYLLKGHFRREKLSTASVLLDGELDRSQFFDPADHEWSLDDQGRPQARLYLNRKSSGIWSWKEYGDSGLAGYWLDYTYIGKSRSGVSVVLADERTGGSTTFPVLMLLKTRPVRVQMDGDIQELLALDIVGNLRIGVPVGSRLQYRVDDIVLKDDKLTILASSRVNDAGEEADLVVDLSGF